jgi:hypothetical protein
MNKYVAENDDRCILGLSWMPRRPGTLNRVENVFSPKSSMIGQLTGEMKWGL